MRRSPSRAARIWDAIILLLSTRATIISVPLAFWLNTKETQRAGSVCVQCVRACMRSLSGPCFSGTFHRGCATPSPNTHEDRRRRAGELERWTPQGEGRLGLGQKMRNKIVRSRKKRRAKWHLRDVNVGGMEQQSGLIFGGEKRGITERTPSRPEWEKENPQDTRGRKEHESLLSVEEKRGHLGSRDREITEDKNKGTRGEMEMEDEAKERHYFSLSVADLTRSQKVLIMRAQADEWNAQFF